jgi:hypothetical protein
MDPNPEEVETIHLFNAVTHSEMIDTTDGSPKPKENQK